MRNFPEAFFDITSLESTLNNAPLFTRDMLKTAAAQVDQARKNTHPMHISGIYSDVRVKIWPTPEKDGINGVDIQWSERALLIEQGEKAVPYLLNRCDGMACETTLPLHGETGKVLEVPALDLGYVQKIKEMEEKWETSPHWANMQKLLASTADRVQIKNIVCIALGTTERDPTRRSRHQHIVASSIARFLQAYYTNNSSASTPHLDVPVITHDPGYTAHDVHLLRTLTPPIQIVSNPHHFLAINPNTLVMCVSCPGFVAHLEIIADVLYPCKPAAILTDEIWDDMPWFAEGKVHLLDMWTPRVGLMLEGMSIVGVEEVLVEKGWEPKWPSGDEEAWGWLGSMILYARDDAVVVEDEVLIEALAEVELID